MSRVIASNLVEIVLDKKKKIPAKKFPEFVAVSRKYKNSRWKWRKFSMYYMEFVDPLRTSFSNDKKLRQINF
jgi:hypothetical protein